MPDPPAKRVLDMLKAVTERLRHASHRQLAVGGAVMIVAAGGIVVGVLATGGKSSKAVVARTLHHATPVAKKTRKAKPPVLFPADRCPLTDVRASGGVVPQRPALLVKIGNEPGPARPQSGLDEADVVFDTPAEGFIMRYVAVYQCEKATAIGPTRSVRWVDYHIAPEFNQPIIAFAGGIPPNVLAVASLPWLSGANLLTAQAGAGYRTTNRYPPDNLYTSTTALYALFPKPTRAPKPIFSFSPALPASAQPLTSADLDFSGGTNVVWDWQSASRSWLHTYSGSPDIDTLTNLPVTTTNIVIEIVPYTIGPYIESTGGTGDIQSETTGTGLGYVLRDGRSLPIIWHRPNLTDPTTFTTTNGKPVGLAPGRTWVEIMTDTQASTGIHFTR
jgi:Protein of unknown function (DUF3048) N-terminal domain/Protein of unknown function (DUF3048) C-terminal domain